MSLRPLLLSALLLHGGLLPAAEDGAAPTPAPAATLVAQPAPPLRVGAWVQGEALTDLDPTQVYVIEFWGTWCGACVEGLPDLAALATRLAGKATFIGVAIGEEGEKADQRAKAVKDFLTSEKISIPYRIAVDTDDQAMQRTWLEAAGLKGVPSACIVAKGRVVWTGFTGAPEFEGNLILAATGTYVASHALRVQDLKAKLLDLQRLLAAANERGSLDGAEATAVEVLAKDIEARDRDLGVAQHDYLMRMHTNASQHFDATMFLTQVHWGFLRTAVLAGTTGPALEPLKEAYRSAAGIDAAKLQRELLRMERERTFVDLCKAGLVQDAATVERLASRLLVETEPFQLDMQAGRLAQHGRPGDYRDLPLALRFSAAAVAQADKTDRWQVHYFWSRHASILFALGRIPEAVTSQRQAAATATDAQNRAQEQATLSAYEAALAKGP